MAYWPPFIAATIISLAQPWGDICRSCRARALCTADSSAAAHCRHQDMAYWPPFTSDTATATCWLAVSDATVENGCMRFVPASHKEAELRHHAPGAV